MATALERNADERLNVRSSIPFFIANLLPLAVIFTGVTMKAAVLCVVLYFTRVFFITGGYHRYFAHRSYRMGRVPQAVMAFLGTTCAQKGPLWWAAHHRHHHRWSDTEKDVHSPLKGFWWSHAGWILCDKYSGTDMDSIRDFAKYPEIRWIDRNNWIGPWALGILSFLIAGLPGLFFGFFLSTVLLWHGTFTVNSLAHVMGRRRYVTSDTSRNSALIATWTLGEGWHNNHHYYQASARNGFFWWEYDPTFYTLKVLSWLGIVKDMKTPTPAILAGQRIRDGYFDEGMFQAHCAKAGSIVRATHINAAEIRDGTDSSIESTRAELEHLTGDAMESASELARLGRGRPVGAAD